VSTMAEDKVDLKELKKVLSTLSLLYVEDTLALQEKATSFFKKLFVQVYTANNGQEGLELFKKHQPSIVITDIQMPIMDGLSMIEAIKKIDANTKVLITSAYDDKEYLLKTIAIGANGYLIKPLNVERVAQELFHLAQDIIEQRSKQIFNTYLYNIFNQQENLVIMFKHDTAILANEHTLSFFNVPSITEFKEIFKHFDTLFLYHNTFLYTSAQQHSCIERAKKEINKLYNVKMLDITGEPHHFIMKLSRMNDSEDFYILSFTDVTELNLLALYDKDALEHDKMLKDEKTILGLMKAAQASQAVIKLYNFYKGLVVSNNAILSYVSKDSSTLKTTFVQQKAAQFEQKIILNCELFPYDLQTSTINAIKFNDQSIEIGPCVMLKTTPRERKYLVLLPHEKHKVNLFYENHRFDTNIKLLDISVESTRIHLDYLPAGIQVDDEITLDMVFYDTIKPVIINTKAKVLKLLPADKAFHLIAHFMLTPSGHKAMIDYMCSRQMQLIREFKGLQL